MVHALIVLQKKNMRSTDFSLRLDAASFYVTRFALTMVHDNLPFDFRYAVLLNSSHDGNRAPDEVIFPEDDHVIQNDLDAKDVVTLLCRDERVPQWIDASVAFKGQTHTHISLKCCGRYHSDDNRLYYYSQGSQPFGIKSPSLPWNRKETERFWLPSEAEYFERIYKQRENNIRAEQAAP